MRKSPSPAVGEVCYFRGLHCLRFSKRGVPPPVPKDNGAGAAAKQASLDEPVCCGRVIYEGVCDVPDTEIGRCCVGNGEGGIEGSALSVYGVCVTAGVAERLRKGGRKASLLVWTWPEAGSCATGYESLLKDWLTGWEVRGGSGSNLRQRRGHSRSRISHPHDDRPPCCR